MFNTTSQNKPALAGKQEKILINNVFHYFNVIILKSIAPEHFQVFFQ